jgi:hypothetical protein
MEPDMQDDTATHPPAFEDQLVEHELPPRPRHRLLGADANPLGIVLLCVLLCACGFIGGVLVEKGEGRSSASAGGTGALASRLAALRGGGSGASGAARAGGGLAALAGAGGGGVGSPTIGQVSYVSGHTLYVTDFEGNTVKVTASAGASVTRTVKSALKSIRPGETVIVTGSRHGDGAIRAQSIRASEASSGGVGAGLGGTLFGAGGDSGSGGVGARRSGGQEGGEGPVLFGK